MCNLPSVEEVLVAWRECRKGKRSTLAALAFEADLSRNIMQLHRDLCDGSYRIGRSACFVVTHPKPREVWASDFRDRIVHHLIYNRIAPGFIKAFAADSCACIPGRGTLYGARRLEAKVRSVSQNWTVPAHYLKLDFANFFTSIDKRIVAGQLAAKVGCAWTLQLALQVLHHDPRSEVIVQSTPALMALVPPHKSLFKQDAYHGLPIGDLNSQLCANIHLDDLDQFVLHQVRPMGYVRYVDDLVLLHTSPQVLLAAQRRIEAFALDQLGLRLNPRKTILQPVERGVDFVGHVILPHRTCARPLLLANALQKMPATEQPRARRALANSYLGLMRQGSNFQSRRSLVKAARLMGHSHDYNAERIFAK